MQGSVNAGRVVLGGLVAGLIMSISEFVLNEVVLVDQQSRLFEAMGLTPPSGSTVLLFIVLTFACGIGAIWLYSMLRSHSGPGMGTAMCAGMFVFFFYAFLPNTFFWGLGMAPGGMAVTTTVWMLAEILVATVAGAYLYQD